jgi:hypothetical protein
MAAFGQWGIVVYVIGERAATVMLLELGRVATAGRQVAHVHRQRMWRMVIITRSA